MYKHQRYLRNIFTCFFLFILNAGKSQVKNGREIFLTAGIQYNHINAIDETFSLVPFRGWKPGAIVELAFAGNRLTQDISVKFFSGKLAASPESSYEAKQLFASFKYNRLYLLTGTDKSFKIMFGGSFQSKYVQRKYLDFTNNQRSFEFISSLGAVANFSLVLKNSKFEEMVELIDRVNIPIVGVLYQPAFGSDQTVGNMEGKNGIIDFFKSSHVVSFPDYLEFTNCFSVKKNISHNQFVGLMYDVNIYRISGVRKMRQFIQSLGVSYTFKL